jgi:hypothetical protein
MANWLKANDKKKDNFLLIEFCVRYYGKLSCSIIKKNA